MIFKDSVLVLILSIIFIFVNGDEEIGDTCHHAEKNIEGKCVLLNDCAAAIKDITDKKHPQICGFQERVPVVCCPHSQKGLVAEKKCWEYSESVYKIVPPSNVFVNKEPVNISTCTVTNKDLYPSENSCINAKPKELPHMVVLGYGRANNKKWKCSGTLISEKFILTAAHCIHLVDYGEVKFIRLAELDLTAFNDADPEDFYAKEIFKHPEYVPPSRYNDIALIEMDRPTKFNEFIRPACLQVVKDIPVDRYTAIGWSQIHVGDQQQKQSKHLQKINKYRLSLDECSNAAFSISGLRDGINGESQLCAQNGNTTEFCEMDSGGPLQINHPKAHCMYSIIGVSSIGKVHSKTNSPYIYTRVSNYIEWIEHIVWKSYFM